MVVLDNLSTGFASAVTHGALVVGDTGDSALVARVLRDYAVDTIMHFAAHTIVPESVADPLKYYRNNTAATRNLLECAQAAGVQHFVRTHRDVAVCRQFGPGHTTRINFIGISVSLRPES